MRQCVAFIHMNDRPTDAAGVNNFKGRGIFIMVTTNHRGVCGQRMSYVLAETACKL